MGKALTGELSCPVTVLLLYSKISSYETLNHFVIYVMRETSGGNFVTLFLFCNLAEVIGNLHAGPRSAICRTIDS